MNIILSILSGFLLALAFPKFNLYWLAWIALVPFFVALARAKDWRESLFCGFFFGVFFFGTHLFWVTTLFRFVGWWIGLGWVALTLYQTLFVLLFVVLSQVAGRRLQVIAIPIIWVAIEWLRAWGPFGVTGGDVGYSQVQLLPLIQIASFTSIYGISFLVVLVNAAIANVGRSRGWGFLLFALLLVIGSYGYGQWLINRASSIEHRASSVKLALIQPNIDQKDKLDPAKVLPTFDLYEKMTRQAILDNPDIIVWPETAIFSYLLHDSTLLPRVKQLAIDSKAWLVFGTPHYVEGKATIVAKAYNSIVSMSPSGEVISRYDKQHLVPFGEYLPFRKILYPILKGVGFYEAEFSSNPDPNLIRVGDLKIAAAVCFESTFPGLIRQRVKKDSDFILLVTNDAWFGNSSALYFHLNTGVFRAIENRKYFVQVGNTGLSAVIDPYGRILKKTKLNQQEILTFEIPLS